ncbi:DUF423 domain-containing protein [Aestuariivivens sediminis]|uniref:DUF423 domain-containing protein n=1 Tax=Aestuariivivens sediminis TaxID=2913557 RepID=UPI001F56AB06|nr:DUF423 domain-containing protein [Aestuariivivens sediminis]
MKTWNFKTESNPTDISKKLESKLGLDNGFVISVDNDIKNSITFKIRKRILYGWYWAYQNWTIINGKLLKIDTEDKTNVEISFNQHFLIRLIMFTHIFLALGLLIAIISGISNSNSLYIFGGIILVLGVFLWVALQRKFEKDTQKYKTLISEILES